MLPRVDVPPRRRSTTSSTRRSRSSSPGASSRTAGTSTAARSAASRIVIAVSEHVRDDLIDRFGSTRRGCGRSTTASTTSASRPDGAPARAVPALPGERVAAQEPRAAVRGVRARPPRAAGAAARPHRRRPPRRRCPTASSPAAACRRRARRALPERRGARLPEPLRGLRHPRRSRRWRAAARSPSHAPPRSPRSAATRPSTSTRPRSRTSHGASREVLDRPRRGGDRARRALHLGASSRARARRVYRELARPGRRLAWADRCASCFTTLMTYESEFYGRVGAELSARGHEVTHVTVSRAGGAAAARAGRRRALPRRRRRRGRRAGSLADEVRRIEDDVRHPPPARRLPRRLGLRRAVGGAGASAARSPTSARSSASSTTSARTSSSPRSATRRSAIAAHLIGLARGIPVLFLLLHDLPEPAAALRGHAARADRRRSRSCAS